LLIKKRGNYAARVAAATFLANLLILRAAVLWWSNPLPRALAILLSASTNNFFAVSMSLPSNATITFFTAVYRRHTNFAIQTIPQYFTGDADFGKKVYCQILKQGLKRKMSRFW
jgi:hypothetical protein